MFFEFRISLPREAVTVPTVRHLCRDTFERLGVADDCISDLEIALTEACSNVLKHAENTDSEYEVCLQVQDHRCTITVTDAGEATEEDWMEEPPSPAALDAESGRGLHMMRALVDDLSFISRPKVGTIVHLEKTLVFGEDSLLAVAAAKE
ncbi:MAG TPA: ATP-binding protein [Actinomycetota bacterium]|nr:ATP-binding protein [Actinomycetota bacterium]